MNTLKTAAKERNVATNADSLRLATRDIPVGLEVGLLTGCQDRPYAFGLAMALVEQKIRLDVIGSDEVDSPELYSTPNLRFLKLRGRINQYDSMRSKLWKLSVYYVRLMEYIAGSKTTVVHILWNTKIEVFERTLLMLYFKLFGKKIALTAHNVNQAKRDSNDSWFNRLTLRIQYSLCDHIFVHTKKMKVELCEDFGVTEKAITVIRHPLNDAFPDTALTPSQAKQILRLADDEKAILFFGRLRPYKGIEHLLAAFQQLLTSDVKYRLIVAGAPNKGNEDYVEEIRRSVSQELSRGQATLRADFIPDKDIEIYLKAADVLALPYKNIFQSGVLFLSYSFGLPVVVTDVGSFREEVVEGETGFVCKPGDPAELAATLSKYFGSDLYKELSTRRQEIKDYARRVHSWSAVAELSRKAYVEMLGARVLDGSSKNGTVQRAN